MDPHDHVKTHISNLAKQGDHIAMALKPLDVPAWCDIFGIVEEQGLLVYEDYEYTGYKLFFMRYDNAGTISMLFQMPHTWDPTVGTVKPHIHFVPCADPGATPQVFALKATYTWAIHGGLVAPQAQDWITTYGTQTITSSMMNKSSFLRWDDLIVPPGAGESSFVLFKVERDLANDTYNTNKDDGTIQANIAILSIDLHYRQSRLGTQTLY